MRAVFALTLALIACETATPETTPGELAGSGDVVMTVNEDIKIHQNEYDAVMSRIPPEQKARMEAQPGGMGRIHEQFGMSQVLYKRAIEAGLHNDPEVLDALAMNQRDFLASVYVQRSGDDAVTDEAVSKRYEERKVQYARPQVKARHILVKEESLANELLGKIQGGEDFAKLAAEHSTDPGSKIKGGDLGWFEQRRMDPAFGEAAFAADKGALVGPVESRYGFHLIEVQDKRDSVPLEDVKDELAGSIRSEARQALLTEIKGSIKVTVNGEELKTAAPPAMNPNHPAMRGQAPIPPGTKIQPPPSAPPKPAGDGHEGHNH